jgi:hypothetical protein
MKFTTLFQEMAVMKGSYDNDTFSHEDEWYSDYKPDVSNDTKLLGQNGKGLKLYKTEYIMFLTTNTDEYLGAIEYSEIRKTLHIETAHSTMKRDFYKNIFALLLTKYKELKSDHVLSERAYKSYEKLKSTFKLSVLDRDGNYYPFTKENLFVDTNGEEFHSDKHSIDEYFRIISIKK